MPHRLDQAGVVLRLALPDAQNRLHVVQEDGPKLTVHPRVVVHEHAAIGRRVAQSREVVSSFMNTLSDGGRGGGGSNRV